MHINENENENETGRFAATILLVAAGALLLMLAVAGLIKPQPYEAVAGSSPSAYRINPNTADVDTLCLLPGIGPSTARHIVSDREVNGPFIRAGDMQRAHNVGPKRVVAIEPWVAFD